MISPRRLLLLSTALLLRPGVLRAEEPPVLDVPVDVNQQLPTVWFLPTSDSSREEVQALARVVRMAGIFEPMIGRPEQQETGFSVRVRAIKQGDGVQFEANSSRPGGTKHRRLLQIPALSRSLDLARLADAILEDLSGTRSHLSGRILFTDASIAGQRSVRSALAAGGDEQQISPTGAFARGGDFTNQGRVLFAMSTAGEPLRLFSEGDPKPVALTVSGHVQTVAIRKDNGLAALVVGAPQGTTIWLGPLAGPMKRVQDGGIAAEPAFGPGGQLAYVAGPTRGPLRVYVDDQPVSPPGLWATSPSFCAEKDRLRVLYAGTDGALRLSTLSGETSGFTRGIAAACSPDGRTALLVREGKGDRGGLFLSGLAGGMAVRIRAGAATGLRWIPGPALPPEG